MLKYFKHIFNYTLEKVKMAEQSFMIAMAIFIGMLGGAGSWLVHLMITFFQGLFFRHETHGLLSHIDSMDWWLLILIPAIGGAIVGPIIYFFAREAKGHGVPEVMEAVVKSGGIMRARVVFVKAISSALCIGSGGSTGQEGPIVQIGASIGSAVGQLLKLSPNKIKTLIGCGAAAGIAATFNAPIAGALFAVEIILGEFGVAQFSPIVISSVVATVVSHQLSGNDPSTFKFPTTYEMGSLWELIPYILLGLLAALVAVLFVKILYKFEDVFDEFKIPEYLKPMIGGVLLGVIAIQFPQIFGTGHEIITDAIKTVSANIEPNSYGNVWSMDQLTDVFMNGKHIKWSWCLMITLVFLKIFSTSLTLGSGGSGGIFAPSLFIGAMLGGGFGLLTVGFFAETLGISTEAFPVISMLVAMGAVVAAATHAPITAILIIFELTEYNYHIILPLMVASIISTVFARKLKKESIYTLKLIRRGVNIEAGREVNVLKSIQVQDIMDYKKAVIPKTLKLREILDIVVNSPHTCYVIIDDDGTILGTFTLHDFKRILADYEEVKDFLIASDLVQQKMIYVKEENDLDYAMNQFAIDNTDELPVLSQDGKELLGVLWKNDVIKSYNTEILKAEMAGGIAKRISSIEYHQSYEVIPGYSMIEFPVPKKFTKRSLIDVNVRAVYSVEVILIKTTLKTKKGIEEFRSFPYGDYVFRDQDKILLFGKNSDIEKFKNL